MLMYHVSGKRGGVKKVFVKCISGYFYKIKEELRKCLEQKIKYFTARIGGFGYRLCVYVYIHICTRIHTDTRVHTYTRIYTEDRN